MSNELIIIFENSDHLEELLELKKNQNTIIISMNFSAHKILEDANIQHIISDTFLTDSERKNIQFQAESLSDWYKNSKINNNLIYHDVNLGSLIKLEFINILVNFLKKFLEFYKISSFYPNSSFHCTNTSKEIMKNFTKNISIFNLHETPSNFSPLDDLKVGYTIGTKNHSFEIKLPKKIFSTLKSFSEITSNMLVKPKPMKPNTKCMLFSEFNTMKQKNFLVENPHQFIIYNRRQPVIWNKTTISLIKNSQARIESENTLSSKTLKHNSIRTFKSFEHELDELFNNDSIFTEIFKFNNMSFWHLIKTNFIKLFKRRTYENIYEIELVEKLLKKYCFSGIIINNDVGSQEQIISQLAKKQNISIFLNQHGLIFDTEAALGHNLHGGVISPTSDFTLVWGKVDQKYREACGINRNRIIEIGSSAFDNLEKTKPDFTKTDYVVLAIQSPTDENVFDLTTQIRQKNIETIEYVCKLLTKLKLDLVIKMHPDPNEFNPTKIAHTINPNIQIIQNGNFASIIKNAKFVIVIDFSTVILDCHILKKPVISLPIKDKLGIPTALKNGSCLYINTNDLEQTIHKLEDKDFYEKIIQKGLINASEYLSFRDAGAKQLTNLLEKYTVVDNT